MAKGEKVAFGVKYISSSKKKKSKKKQNFYWRTFGQPGLFIQREQGYFKDGKNKKKDVQS